MNEKERFIRGVSGPQDLGRSIAADLTGLSEARAAKQSDELVVDGSIGIELALALDFSDEAVAAMSKREGEIRGNESDGQMTPRALGRSLQRSNRVHSRRRRTDEERP